MKVKFKIAIVLVSAVPLYDMHAKPVITQVFPVVCELVKSPSNTYVPKWYVLLGKNVRGTQYYKQGAYDALIQVAKDDAIPVAQKKMQALTILASQTKGVYNEGDLTTLIKRGDQPWFADDRRIIYRGVEETSVHIDNFFVVLGERKPFERLNRDGVGRDKSGYQWFSVSALTAMNEQQLNKLGIERYAVAALNAHFSQVIKNQNALFSNK